MADGESEQEPQVESLPTNAATPQGESAPAQPVDTGEQATPKAGDAPSPPPVENGSKDKPRDERGRFAEAESDPVQQAIAKLSKPDPGTPPAKAEKADPKAPKPSAKAPEQGKPGEPAKPATAKQPDTASSTTDLTDLNPPDDEKARWHPKTRERFDKVFGTLREARTQLEELTPHAENGKQFASMLDEYGVRDDIGFVAPEHLAGVIHAQASINRAALAVQQGRNPARADIEAIASMGKVVDTIRQQFGIASAAPAADAGIKPFEGDLPADLKDLIEVYGVDEKRVRLLAALEGRPAQAAQPAKPQAHSEAPPPAQQPAPGRPEGVDMGQLYTRQWLGELREAGDQNPAQTMRVVLAHPATKAEVMRRFPGTTAADVPAIFNALEPKDRIDVMRAAHRAMTKPQVPAQSRPSNPPPPTHQRTLTGGAPRAAAPAANGDPVAAAIAHLARQE